MTKRILMAALLTVGLLAFQADTGFCDNDIFNNTGSEASDINFGGRPYTSPGDSTEGILVSVGDTFVLIEFNEDGVDVFESDVLVDSEAGIAFGLDGTVLYLGATKGR